MSGNLFVNPHDVVVDSSGQPLAGAVRTFWLSGTETLTPIYADAALSAFLMNPVQADDDGVFPAIWLDPTISYRVKLTTRTGAFISDDDPVSNNGAVSIYPQLPSEPSITDGRYPNGDSRRYGLVPNLLAAATTNTNILRTLLNPSGNYSGAFSFINTTGADIYYFNDFIPIHDGVHWDLGGCTLSVTKTAVAADTASGFIFPIRDFICENGSISVNYNMAGVATSAGSAFHLGTRGTDSSLVAAVWDSLLTIPTGNIVLRNLHITSNVATGNGIEMTGGLRNVTIENVVIDGGSALAGGIYYEFGWATSGTTNLRQTSHANNITIRNVTVNNITGTAVTMAGAYNYLVENLKAYNAGSVFVGTPGESLNYRPWATSDLIGAKRTKTLRNLIGDTITGTGITLTGAQSGTGYLNALGLTGAALVDLSDYVLDGFAMDGTNAGYGLLCSAGQASISNGRITGFQDGIRGTDDWTHIGITNIRITGCTKTGINLDAGAGVYGSIRLKVGSIRNCIIAGNSTSAAGSFPGISLNNTASFLIEACRLNYETAHDGSDETTTGNAVQLGALAAGVVCKANRVGVVIGGSFAYYNVTATAANNNTVENPTGTITYSGSWKNVYKGISATAGDANRNYVVGSDFETILYATALTANRAITLSTTGAASGDEVGVTRTGLGAFTLDFGGLKTLPISTAAFARAKFNGTAWLLTAYGTL